MTIKSNSWLSKIKPYRLASHKIWEKNNIGNMLKLDWNESTVPPAPMVIEEVNRFLGKNLLHLYPDTNNVELLEHLSSYTGLPINNIQYFASSDAAHEYVIKTFISEGDVVLLQDPTYDNFRVACEASGADIFKVKSPSSRDFIKEVGRLVGLEKVKAIYICNPNNPTGGLVDIADILDLARNFEDKLVIVDEAYYEFSGKTISEFINNCRNIVVTRTFSKAFGLAQLRIGYILAAEPVICEINKIRNSKSVSMISQIAATAALKNFSYTAEYVREVHRAKELFVNALGNALGPLVSVHESHANFVMITFQSSETAEGVRSHLERNGIFVRPLDHLGISRSIRVTIGNSDQMKRVLYFMRQFLL
jgi:histidinol-phosphate aminotransferase